MLSRSLLCANYRCTGLSAPIRSSRVWINDRSVANDRAFHRSSANDVKKNASPLRREDVEEKPTGLGSDVVYRISIDSPEIEPFLRDPIETSTVNEPNLETVEKFKVKIPELEMENSPIEESKPSKSSSVKETGKTGKPSDRSEITSKGKPKTDSKKRLSSSQVGILSRKLLTEISLNRPVELKTSFDVQRFPNGSRKKKEVKVKKKDLLLNDKTDNEAMKPKKQVVKNDRKLLTEISLNRPVELKTSFDVQRFPNGSRKERNLSKGTGKEKVIKSQEVCRLGDIRRFNRELLSFLHSSVTVGDVAYAEEFLRKVLLDNAIWKSKEEVLRKSHAMRNKPLIDSSPSPHTLLSTAPFHIVMSRRADEGDVEACLAWIKDIKNEMLEIDSLAVMLTLSGFGKVLEEGGETTRDLQARLGHLVNDARSLTLVLDDSRLTHEQKRRVSLAASALNLSKNAPAMTTQLYLPEILKDLNEEQPVYPNPLHGAFDPEEIKKKFEQSIKQEVDGRVQIKQVGFTVDQRRNPRLEHHEKVWRQALEDRLAKRLNLLREERKFSRRLKLDLYPYLSLLPKDVMVDLMLSKISEITLWNVSYNRAMTSVFSDLGYEIHNRVLVESRRIHGDCFREVYSRYVDFLSAPTRSEPTERLFWQRIRDEYPAIADVEIPKPFWPRSIRALVGREVLEIIVDSVVVYPEIVGKKGSNPFPAFYKLLLDCIVDGKCRKVNSLKPHPFLVELFCHDGSSQSFVVNEIPMVVPPLPWMSLDYGGNLLLRNKLVRNYNFSSDSDWETEHIKAFPAESLHPILDAMNHLGACPWRVNCFVLDVATAIFSSGGEPKLAIPIPASAVTDQIVSLPTPTSDMDMDERRQLFQERRRLIKERFETHSLWCTASYKLTLAENFRNDVLWYPFFMDFRGRVYPFSSNLNHMGDDLTRGLLTFAKGKPLGPKGLDWLKIHVINLTGLKKRESTSTRLAFAEEILPEILDSASRPLKGRKWWMSSEEPWETLAACKEIADAMSSPDPTLFVSRLPVHQDGSCNGLQHYAALGRDLYGGESVNLRVSDKPNDVYSDVLELVERKRAADAANGIEEAQMLEGFVSRKVIKQTIMTTVYGVTNYGARAQIANRLQELDSFPKEGLWKCSVYLAQTTLGSLTERFVATKKIQNWFNDLSTLVTRVNRNPMTWVTPLGLPVMQPYCKRKNTQKESTGLYSAAFLPDSNKQKNGFAPNFIHSLDATHMFLTALHAHRRGIVFNAVHDCFWTHAADVDEINVICREQFVNLHSLPILENLGRHLAEANRRPKFVETNETEWSEAPSVVKVEEAADLMDMEDLVDAEAGKLREAEELCEVSKAVKALRHKNAAIVAKRMDSLLEKVLAQVPPRGKLDIEEVKKSEFFFS